MIQNYDSGYEDEDMDMELDMALGALIGLKRLENCLVLQVFPASQVGNWKLGLKLEKGKGFQTFASAYDSGSHFESCRRWVEERSRMRRGVGDSSDRLSI